MIIPKTLCQPGGKSCGGCCGMYNQRGESDWVQTIERLAQRTLAYRRDADIQDADSLERFREEWEPRPEDKLLDGLPSCPFLGLLELQAGEQVDIDAYGTVGCLVHPFQNDGVDGRDCGVYDRFVCEDYLCASHDVMKDDEKRLVLVAVRDSYLYGVVITDTRFVRELFEGAATINGMMPRAEHLARPEAIECARAYFELKRTWPYRDVDAVFGQVVPVSGLDTARRPGPSEQVNVEDGAHEAILRCLGTRVGSVSELEDARQRVDQIVRAFARAVEL